jgi:hypothetical protein
MEHSSQISAWYLDDGTIASISFIGEFPSGRIMEAIEKEWLKRAVHQVGDNPH